MKINFITSSRDPAGLNMANKVIEKFGLEDTGKTFCDKAVFEKGRLRLLYVDVESVFLDQVFLPYDSDLIIMLSRHESEKTVNSLTAHPTGNLLDEAKLGGNPKHVAYTNPWYMSEYYRNLVDIYKDTSGDSIVLSMEVTHHGPTEKNTPLFFVEIGSDETHWRNESLAEKIAEALLATIDMEPKKADAFVGFGGGHYAPAFSHHIREENVALGHIVPKYALADATDEKTLLSLFEKSLIDKPRALVDRKGLTSKQYKNLTSFFDRYSIEFLKI
ncbi:MAG: D-aminoacyl-tRNA deacylase [Nitrososphaeria archaeon]